MRKLKSDFNDRSRGGGDLRAPRMLRALLPDLGCMLEVLDQQVMAELVPWAGHMV